MPGNPGRDIKEKNNSCLYAHRSIYSGMMNYKKTQARALIMKALAHPVRLIVVDALSKRDLCVRELNNLVGVDQSTLSRHLARLKQTGIVTERKEGVKVFHHLATPCILKVFECTERVLATRLKEQAALLS